MEKKETFGEMIRFGIVGVLAVAVHYGVYWVLMHWMNVNIAYTLGYLISFLMNYYLSAHFTFHEETSTQNGLGFGVAHLCNYLLHIVLFNLFLWLGFSRELAPFAVLAIAVPANFVMVRFVFKHFNRSKLAMVHIALIMLLASGACRGTFPKTDNFPLAEPDYESSSQWYHVDRQGVADIFYIISTETADYPLPDGSICHHADTYTDSLRQPMLSEMEGVDSLLSGELNFFSPYYRQCSLQSFVSDSLAQARMALPMEDVRRAFAHYLEHQNQGRPFILAGFSQGAMIAVQLLCEVDEDVYRRMVAAYIIGACIPQKTLDNCDRIRPAQRADDTGVTVCYNSVRDASIKPLWPRSAAAINPVNWRTDDKPDTLITEPSHLLALDQQKKDTLVVRLDTVSNQLFVSGYTATDYVLPLIGSEGNYHSREIWLYRNQLRENMQLRVKAAQASAQRSPSTPAETMPPA